MTAFSAGKPMEAVQLPQLRAAATTHAGHPIVLAVIHGVHGGAEISLHEPVHTIGSSTEADIVLGDAGVGPIHARLRRQGGIVEIEAIGGDVVLASGETIKEGHGSRCRLPVVMTLGGATVRLASQRRSTDWTAAGRLAMAAGCIVFVLCAITFTASGLSKSLPGLTHLASASDGEPVKVAFADQGRQRTLNDSSPLMAQTLAEAESQLRQRLDQSGLGALTIEKSSERLVVSGVITNDMSGAWTATQSWFDQKFGAHVALASAVMIGNAQQAPRLMLQAIWYGEQPYVIAADGARYHEGAFTDDGWTVKHIGDTELLLTKGGATVALKYQ